nr:serine/threonine-protein kinase [Leptolyngbya sp. FACHB-17]
MYYHKTRKIGIGEGMNSEVFEIQDSQLGGRLVAKEIPIVDLQNSVHDYFAEAKAMFASAHRNIVPIQYAATRDNTHVCLIMPYFARGSLQSHICFNPLPLKHLINLGQEILTGISQIHMKGYLHLDIKPSNVLFSDSGVAMVADFGQARAIGSNGIVTKLPPMYSYAMPPEVLTQKFASIESDIYQVGLTLYRAVNGDYMYQQQLPRMTCLKDVEELQHGILSGTLPDRAAFLPHVPAKLRKAIKKAIDPISNKRFSSAIKFQEALGRISLTCDWNTQINPETGEINWKGCRRDRADLVVNLYPVEGTEDWSVQIFTERECTSRRGAHKEFWIDKVSLKEATTHLETFFQSLV